jgi:hypothetical protein
MRFHNAILQCDFTKCCTQSVTNIIKLFRHCSVIAKGIADVISNGTANDNASDVARSIVNGTANRRANGLSNVSKMSLQTENK